MRRCVAEQHGPASRRHRISAGFTLTELLVAMAVVVILAIVTVVSFRSVFLEARLSSGANTVSASLAQARALAVRDGRPVLVAFVPRLHSPREKRVDIHIARWTGETGVGCVDRGEGAFDELFDRYRPVPDRKVRTLPGGINVAGPMYSQHMEVDVVDDAWVVPSNPLQLDEAPGRMIGVMFGPDGSVMTENPASGADHVWIDFQMTADSQNSSEPDIEALSYADECLSGTIEDWYDQYFRADGLFDETCIQLVPFLAVFNEREARELYIEADWTDSVTRIEELSEYINEFADRLHFNRYTGVVMQ